MVDISSYVDLKVDVNIANDTQGPAGVNGSRLRQRLAEQGKKLPVLGDDDDTANRQYIKEFVLENDRQLGHEFGVEYAEKFHYIGRPASNLDDYIERNAVSI